MNQTERTIKAIVSRITTEITKTSESKSFLNEVERIVSVQYLNQEFSDFTEAQEFEIEVINKCIKQMVNNIMGNYVTRTCKPRERVNDKEIVVIKAYK